MILPDEFDLQKSDDELVRVLVESDDGYDADAARALVEAMRDPDGLPFV